MPRTDDIRADDIWTLEKLVEACEDHKTNPHSRARCEELLAALKEAMMRLGHAAPDRVKAQDLIKRQEAVIKPAPWLAKDK